LSLGFAITASFMKESAAFYAYSWTRFLGVSTGASLLKPTITAMMIMQTKSIIFRIEFSY